MLPIGVANFCNVLAQVLSFVELVEYSPPLWWTFSSDLYHENLTILGNLPSIKNRCQGDFDCTTKGMKSWVWEESHKQKGQRWEELHYLQCSKFIYCCHSWNVFLDLNFKFEQGPFMTATRCRCKNFLSYFCNFYILNVSELPKSK